MESRSTHGYQPSPRAAITAVFAAFGLIGGIWCGTLPTVTRGADLEGVWLGALFTAAMLAIVVAMTIGGWLAHRVSPRRMLLAIIPSMTFAAIALHSFGAAAAVVPALLAYGFCQGLCDLFMNAEGSRIEADLGRPIYSGLHGVCSLTLAMAAIAGSLIATGVGPWAAAPIFLAAGTGGVWMVARAIPERAPAFWSGSTGAARAQVAYGPLLFLGIAVGFENAGETAAILWSAKMLNEAAPQLAAIAGLGPAFYAGCNAAVRLNGDRIRARYGDTRVVVVSLLIAACGLLGVGIAPSFVLRVAAFAVTGFGTACVIPCLYAIVGNSDPQARAARLGFVSMVAGPPRVLAPLLFGWIVQNASLGVAFSVSSVLMLLALGAFLASQSGTEQQHEMAARI